jgi:hypothetical protein
MANDIGVGDLVCVVKPTACCGNNSRRGLMFYVTKIGRGGTQCPYCAALHDWASAVDQSGMHFGLPRLQKINPPATGTEAQTSRERHEPKRRTEKA